MAARTSVPPGVPARPGPRGGHVLLTVLACALQALVLFATFVMGLGWGGVTYAAALVQAGLGFVLILRLAARGRGLVLLVPLVSAGLTVGLVLTGTALGRAAACGDAERAAVEQLAPPPGTTVEFEGEYTEGCVARTRTSLSSQVILEHYEAELTRLGWRPTPDRQEATVGTAAEKDGVSLIVDINTAGEGGAETLEVVVDAGSGTPCATNTVDGFLERTPTTAVEPGTWAVLVSTQDDPASVAIRDSRSAVVFEQQARRRPETSGGGPRTDDMPDEVETLRLEEGTYSVECSPRGTAPTRVPLRVTWDSAAGAQQDKDVVVRVFETPEHWR